MIIPITAISNNINNPPKFHIYFKTKRKRVVTSAKNNIIILDTIEISTEAMNLYLQTKEHNE